MGILGLRVAAFIRCQILDRGEITNIFSLVRKFWWVTCSCYAGTGEKYQKSLNPDIQLYQRRST
ncbi:hypothetical protein I7I48_12176 [Histoplasma ohiense]|nr:hypothetical protein I7I48_12176 [Histoplasma ohiense (nom. inval.)]